jgi:hypothetical protein
MSSRPNKDGFILLVLRGVVLSGAKNLYDYLRDPSLSLRETRKDKNCVTSVILIHLKER